MGPSFHHADRQTYRRVAVVGALFCIAFVAISFSLGLQVPDRPALVKAVRPVRTVGEAVNQAATKSTFSRALMAL